METLNSSINEEQTTTLTFIIMSGNEESITFPQYCKKIIDIKKYLESLYGVYFYIKLVLDNIELSDEIFITEINKPITLVKINIFNYLFLSKDQDKTAFDLKIENLKQLVAINRDIILKKICYIIIYNESQNDNEINVYKSSIWAVSKLYLQFKKIHKELDNNELIYSRSRGGSLFSYFDKNSYSFESYSLMNLLTECDIEFSNWLVYDFVYL